MSYSLAIRIILIENIRTSYVFASSMLRSSGRLVADHEEVVSITYADDVRIYDGELRLACLVERRLEEYLRLRDKLCEIVIYVSVEDRALVVMHTHGKMDHDMAGLVVVHHLGGPYCTRLAPWVRVTIYVDHASRELEVGEIDISASPVDEVERLHEDEGVVVSPAVERVGAFPVSGAI